MEHGMGMMERLPDAPGGAAAESRPDRRLLLPGGWVADDGRVLRAVHVRQLNGSDEEALFNRAGGSGAERVTTLLARVIDGVEGLAAPVDAGFAAGLSVGDRDYLLLRLRQLDLGDAVHQVLRCTHCGGKADIDFLISEMPLRRADAPAALHHVELGDCSVWLRLPTGADQAAVEALALANPAAANTRLYARIVHDVDGAGPPSEDEVRAWPLPRRARLAAWLAQALPGPDLLLDLACPHCQGDISYAFDVNGFFLPNA
jgi:hypothetical protein